MGLGTITCTANGEGMRADGNRSGSTNSLAFLLEETARKILPEAVLTCCVSGNIHMGCGYYKWGSRDVIRYSDIDAASVCIGSHSAG